MPDIRLTIEIGEFGVKPERVFLTSKAWITDTSLSASMPYDVRKHMLLRQVGELLNLIDRNGTKILEGKP